MLPSHVSSPNFHSLRSIAIISHEEDALLLFAHTGITLGAGILIRRLAASYLAKKTPREPSPQALGKVTGQRRYDILRGAARVMGNLDFRLLLIGSLLPDIIDKPVGHLLFRETFSNGRIFSHTLLFLTLITVLGLCLYRRRQQRWLLILSFGTLAHLILDQMWHDTRTLLWPAYGFVFTRIDLSDWAPNVFRALLSNPAIYVPELIGLGILFWFARSLVQRRKVSGFLRYGRTT